MRPTQKSRRRDRQTYIKRDIHATMADRQTERKQACHQTRKQGGRRGYLSVNFPGLGPNFEFNPVETGLAAAWLSITTQSSFVSNPIQRHFTVREAGTLSGRTDRHIHRQTDSQTDKQASRQIGRHTASRGRQPDRGIHTNTIEYSDRKRGSLTTRQTGRQTQSQEFRQVSSTGGRQTSIQTSGRQRQDRQTERQTD